MRESENFRPHIDKGVQIMRQQNILLKETDKKQETDNKLHFSLQSKLLRHFKTLTRLLRCKKLLQSSDSIILQKMLYVIFDEREEK